MRTTSAISLLVAALVMLRQPCTRSQATARLLLERAAEHTSLSPAEREACLSLADAIETELPAQSAPRPQRLPSASPVQQPGSQTDAWRRTVQTRDYDPYGLSA
ncbi:MAG: hypothetical protein ACK4UX_02510 [Thiobacillus sp.]